ncbi:MAG: hypothetical protein NWF08_05575 [Candidatus Bathyarchaeota archaeon]|nr:hypothetical protein [Candidatus Bathyarchaeota archaeon]
MQNNLKAVIIYGFIAGLIAGIVAAICYIIVTMIGLSWSTFGEYPVVNIAEFNIIMSPIWGIIYGILFSRFQGAIPGRGLMKGFYYGLVLFLFNGVRDVTFWFAYATPIDVIISFLFITFFASIVYGTLLRALYKTEARTIGKYDIGRGANAGFIAGLIGGLIAFFSRRVGMIYFYEIATIGPEALFIFYQLMVHLALNAIWGTLLGIIYTKVYDLVPGKGIKKGFVYGLIAFLICSLHGGTYAFAQAIMAYFVLGYETAQPIFQNYAIPWTFTGAIQVITFGLVLGYLYKK